MPDNKGFEIRHNNVPRTFRDREGTAFEAARYAKSRQPGDIIEIVDCVTGQEAHHAVGWADGLALSVW